MHFVIVSQRVFQLSRNMQHKHNMRGEKRKPYIKLDASLGRDCMHSSLWKAVIHQVCKYVLHLQDELGHKIQFLRHRGCWLGKGCLTFILLLPRGPVVPNLIQYDTLHILLDIKSIIFCKLERHVHVTHQAFFYFRTTWANSKTLNISPRFYMKCSYL